MDSDYTAICFHEKIMSEVHLNIHMYAADAKADIFRTREL